VRHDRTERSAAADRTEATLANEPTEKADRNDPTEPIERTDPTEAIDRIEPREPIHKIEFSDWIDSNELCREVTSPIMTHQLVTRPSGRQAVPVDRTLCDTRPTGSAMFGQAQTITVWGWLTARD
jgi:hypothetical protein